MLRPASGFIAFPLTQKFQTINKYTNVSSRYAFPRALVIKRTKNTFKDSCVCFFVLFFVSHCSALAGKDIAGEAPEPSQTSEGTEQGRGAGCPLDTDSGSRRDRK